MAITIEQAPSNYITPAYNPVVFTLSTTNGGESLFSFEIHFMRI